MSCLFLCDYCFTSSQQPSDALHSKTSVTSAKLPLSTGFILIILLDAFKSNLISKALSCKGQNSQQNGFPDSQADTQWMYYSILWLLEVISNHGVLRAEGIWDWFLATSLGTGLRPMVYAFCCAFHVVGILPLLGPVPVSSLSSANCPDSWVWHVFNRGRLCFSGWGTRSKCGGEWLRPCHYLALHGSEHSCLYFKTLQTTSGILWKCRCWFHRSGCG